MFWLGKELERELRKIRWRLDFIIASTAVIRNQEVRQMAALDDLKAQVEVVKTVEASAITLIQGLHQALLDAIAAGDPAALTALAADLQASATALSDAVAANTLPG